MKRQVLITIDSTATTCGSCPHQDANFRICRAFEGTVLKPAIGMDSKRCTQCLKSEQKN